MVLAPGPTGPSGLNVEFEAPLDHKLALHRPQFPRRASQHPRKLSQLHWRAWSSGPSVGAGQAAISERLRRVFHPIGRIKVSSPGLN
jgi:hypothetical protein